MASKYLQKFQIPTDFPDLLHDFAQFVLMDQPDNIHEYGAAYFKAMEEGVEFVWKGNNHGKPVEADAKPPLTSVETVEQEIKRDIIDTGVARDALGSSHELYSEDHQRSKPVLTGLGGSFMQMYFVVAAVMETGGDLAAYYERIQKDPKDVAAKSPLEMTLEQHFVPFLLRYLNGHQNLTVIASHEMAAILSKFGVQSDSDGFYDLSKLTREQYLHFRNEFVEQRNHNESWARAKNQKAIDLLLNSVCMAMCKRIPEELGIDAAINNKVKMVAPIQSSKRVAAVIKVSEDRAHNPNPEGLPYKVQIINNKAESKLRSHFLTEFVKAVPDTPAGQIAPIETCASDSARRVEDEFLAHAQAKDIQVMNF